MGGIGKTQIAVEFLYRNREDYDAIYWIDASSQSALLTGFQKIAAATNCVLDPFAKNPPLVASLVLSWLQEQGSWLLIMDNLEDISVTKGLLPRVAPGKYTFITTRNGDFRTIPAEGLMIPLLSEDAAVELLRIRSNENVDDQYSLTDKAHAIEVVKELGYLALAIDQAAAFIRSSCKLAEFMEIYRSSRKRYLNRKPYNSRYWNSIAHMVLLSVEELKRVETGTEAVIILQLLAFLKADGVVIEFLRAGCEALRKDIRDVIEDKLTFYTGLEELQKYSLVTLSPTKDRLIIHKLVQEVIRDHMAVSDVLAYEITVVEFFDYVFPQNIDYETLRECDRYQAQILQPLMDQFNTSSTKLANLFGRLGKYLRLQGMFKDSSKALERALRMSTVVDSADSSETLALKTSLAMTYCLDSRRNKGQELHEEVYEIRKRKLGDRHPETLESLLHLGVLDAQSGRIEPAINRLNTCVRARESRLGRFHSDTLASENLLAACYARAGRFIHAESLQKELLSISESVPPKRMPQKLAIADNLALTYAWRGELDKALELSEHTMDQVRELMGAEHPDTLSSMHNLGYILARKDNLPRAIEIFEYVLNRRRELLGPEHLGTFASMHNLAVAYREMTTTDVVSQRSTTVVEYLRKAALLLEESSKGFQKILGCEHMDTLNSMLALAEVYTQLGSTRWGWEKSEDLAEVDRIRYRNESKSVRGHVSSHVRRHRHVENSSLLITGPHGGEMKYLTSLRGLKDFK